MEVSPSNFSSAPKNQRDLNAFDQCILSIHDTQQKDGNPGFETLALLHLEATLDPFLLRAAVDELGNRHPVLTARLKKVKGRRVWNWAEPVQLWIHDQELSSTDEEEILSIAGSILSRPRDLQKEPGLEFHVLHLPDETDILVLHANHALLDHQSIRLILQELSGLLSGESNFPTTESTDLVASYRSGFTRKQRRQAFRRTFPDYWWDRWSRKSSWPRQLPTHGLTSTDLPGEIKVIAKRLTAEETEAVTLYAAEITRMPSVSMTVLGSVFYSFAEIIPNHRSDDLFRTGVGVELSQQNLETFHPQNASSVLRLQLTRDELDDPKRRVERLHSQFYQVIKDRKDLGIVEANSLFRRCYPLIRRVSGQMIRRAFSFFYAYFDIPEDRAPEFGGIPLRGLRYIGPAWSPLGLTFLVTKFQGQLDFTLSYVPQIISDEQAEELLEGVLVDLRSAVAELRVEQVPLFQ